MTSTPPAPSAPPAPPAHEALASFRPARVITLSAVAVVMVLLLVGAAQGCAALEGGSVRSEAAFLDHVRDTQTAGETAVRALGSEPASVLLRKSTDNASCMDDLGFDDGGTTRDQPSLSWAPAIAESDAGYRTALATLRERWSERGWKVTAQPVTDPATGRATGLQTISTTDDKGVTLSLRPGRRPGEGLVVADGGCVRHEGSWNASSWSFY
ncbi:hypothetical protein [Streptomyces sp. NBC_00083]|uniref:hypothetical protein n=1 Tax=Streptomyces sp. NBC_00083 TaxID=2975647 RepID=UPI00225502BF|nr:hypothetical protein [Streptomyces sp. NBC_00083]MCX5384576.1 hypothetical protein [Streptomyces sp. NBC_00083]